MDELNYDLKANEHFLFATWLPPFLLGFTPMVGLFSSLKTHSSPGSESETYQNLFFKYAFVLSQTKKKPPKKVVRR